MKKTKFNVNDEATVTLTAKGAEILNKEMHRRFSRIGFVDHYQERKEGDVFSDSLWEIMNIFGQHVFIGCQIPFESNEIEIEKRDDIPSAEETISDEMIMKVLNAIGYEEESWIPVVREHLNSLSK